MKVTIATKIDEEVKKKLEKEAEKNDRTISQEVGRRLRLSFNREK